MVSFVVLFLGGDLLIFRSKTYLILTTIVILLVIIILTSAEVSFLLRYANDPIDFSLTPNVSTKIIYIAAFMFALYITYLLLKMFRLHFKSMYTEKKLKTETMKPLKFEYAIPNRNNIYNEEQDQLTAEAKYEKLLNETVLSLSKAIDARDPYTCFHSNQVAKYSYHIALKMGLTNEANNIKIGALLHDIGKISISEHILNKPDKLAESEEKIMRQHPTNGYEIIKYIEELTSRGVHEIILYHHERYDGLGYPHGLSGIDIPLSARIVAVADSFDAMTTKRSYKDSMSKSAAINQLLIHSDTQFDSSVVMAFLECLDENPELFEKESDSHNKQIQIERGLRSLA